jgi:hypothetical protein
MANVVNSECLCFLSNKFSKFTRAQLKMALTGFYSEDELCEAKDVSFSDAAKVNYDDLPRCVKRPKGDNRARLVTDDIIDLWTLLDEKGYRDRLPIYVAHNIDRVPTVKLEDMDQFCMAQKIEALEKRLCAVEVVKMDCLTSKLDHVCEQMESYRAEVGAAVVKMSTVSAKLLSTTDLLPANTGNSDLQVSLGPDAAGCLSSIDTAPADDPWLTVVRRRSHSSSKLSGIRLRGAKESTNVNGTAGNVRAKPRKKVLAAFVSRLHKDTTAESLSTYLTAEGMKDIFCRKIQPKQGQTFSTAAFFVSCCIESEQLFYDERCWPEGVELRDCIYK